MRFGWSDNQRQLQDMVRRFVAERHDFDTRKARIAAGDGSAIWDALGELGLMALPFAEEDGGLNGGMLDMVLVMEAFGRGLIVEPYVPTVLLAGGLLRRASRTDRISALLASIAEGRHRLAFAWSEAASRYNAHWVECRTTRTATGWVLDGAKAMVPGGDEAQSFIILARTDGDAGDRDGLALFLIAGDAPGLSLRPIRNVDGTSAAEITLSAVACASEDRIDRDGEALSMVETVLADAAVASCAEMIGAITALNEKTAAYVRERKAFGQPIIQFQAIQHRLVDMLVSQEQAIAITLKAAESLDKDRPDALRTVSAAKHLVSEEARAVAKASVQMHGAIGTTDESDVSHYFRRIYALATQYGDADHHMRRYISFTASSAHGEAA
jgi:alkylation response protein AidB-like acyl-CoA dehydrogenase